MTGGAQSSGSTMMFLKHTPSCSLDAVVEETSWRFAWNFDFLCFLNKCLATYSLVDTSGFHVCTRTPGLSTFKTGASFLGVTTPRFWAVGREILLYLVMHMNCVLKW